MLKRMTGSSPMTGKGLLSSARNMGWTTNGIDQVKRCSVTDVPLTIGYVYHDGEMYFRYMEHLLIQLRNDGYEGDDYEVLDDAYDDDAYYFSDFIE